MGNSCCGPREECKPKTTALKEALIKEGKILLNKEYLLNSKGENSFEEKINENEGTKEEVNEESIEFYSKKIENVKNGNYLKDCLHESPKNSKKSRIILKKHSQLNENELKFDTIKGSLIVVNEELINKQKKVVGHLIKQMGLNLLQGKSLMNVSFPVQVFESKSVLNRIAGTFGYAPNFLKKAAESIDVLKQFKFVIAFLISSLHLNISQKKPFNPILGETFQGYLGHSPIFLEQICHHPPISYFYVLISLSFLYVYYHIYLIFYLFSFVFIIYFFVSDLFLPFPSFKCMYTCFFDCIHCFSFIGFLKLIFNIKKIP